MALYWYFPSKDALLDAVVGDLMSRLEPLDPDPTEVGGGDYIAALRRVAHDYRKLALTYPRSFQLLTTRRPMTSGIYRTLEEYVSRAEARGLDARTTARYYRLIAAFCNGACLYDLATLEAAQRQNGRAASAAIPRVAKVLAWLAAEHAEDMFSFCLEHLLTSLEAAAPKPRRRPPAKRTR
jgi:AcrR family transcriptional regulator